MLAFISSGIIRSNSAPDSTVPDMSSFGNLESDGAYVTLFPKKASKGTSELVLVLLGMGTRCSNIGSTCLCLCIA